MAGKASEKRQQPPAGRRNSAAGGRRAASQGDIARKQSAKRRRRRRHGNYILYYLILVVLLLTVGTVLSLTVFFKIETITVTGTDQYPAKELAQSTGVAIGDNLFRIDTAQIVENIKKYPYVDEVTVRRNYPPEVIVTVTEAVPMAAVEMNEGYTVVSDKGRILETGLSEAPASLPLVIGLRITGRPGEWAGEEAQEGLSTLRYLADALEEVSFPPVEAIDLSDRLNIVLRQSADLSIELGVESDLARKLKFALEVMDNRLEPGFKGTLYADTVGKVRADPEDDQRTEFSLPEDYVFDEESGTFVPSVSSGSEEESSLEEDQDIVE